MCLVLIGQLAETLAIGFKVRQHQYRANLVVDQLLKKLTRKTRAQIEERLG